MTTLSLRRSLSRTLTRRTAAVAAAALLGLGLAACSDDDDNSDATTTASDSAGDSTAATSEAPLAAGDTPANDPGTPQITADRTVDLADGDEITVTVRGLDTSAGYYLGICKVGTGADAAGEGGAPDCTGDRSSSKWIAADAEQRATDHFDADGNAEVTLTVAEKGDAVDCSVDECAIKVFGDHMNGFRAVGEAPVSFAS